MKRLIFCFDGTANDPGDADQDETWLGLGEQEDNGITNVLKLHLLFGGDLQGRNVFGDQLSFYYPGVGTYGSWVDKIRNMALAPPDEDVGMIIKRAVRDLYRHYEKGDQIYLFGFSRGAAIARRFAGVLEDTFEALDRDCPDIEFMGVFDTVAAIKHPNLFREGIRPGSDVVFENGTVSARVSKALHLLALDDRRIAFYPTLMNKEDKVEEIWFAGAHADVGGGYKYDGLSDTALRFMLDYIEERQPGIRMLTAMEINYGDLFEGPREVIEFADVNIQPNHLGRNHEQEAITRIREKMLSFRVPRVNVNDKHSVHPPVVHHSVIDRIRDDDSYLCEPLLNRMVNPYTGAQVALQVLDELGRLSTYATLAAAVEARQHEVRELAVGEQVAVTVHASRKYNPSGIRVQPGQTFLFRIDMKQRWYDADTECGPDGWDEEDRIESRILRWGFSLAASNRRHPKARWFEITGCIGRDESSVFKLLNHTRKGKEYAPDNPGELMLFANDLGSKYGNNRGSISVRVSRST